MPSPWNPHTVKGTFGSQGYEFDAESTGGELDSLVYHTCPGMAFIRAKKISLNDTSDLFKEDCCRLAVLSHVSRGGISFPVNYKDGTICKSSSNGTLEGTALGSLWHDCLLSLCQLCLVWEETGQLHSGDFLLTFWPWFLRCVHVFTCISWRNRSLALGHYSKEKVCPFAFGWKVWSFGVAADQV